MKPYLVCVLAGALGLAANAAEGDRAEKKPRWFGFQIPALARVRASFSGQSTGNPGTVGTATDPYQDRFYDDGYLRVNSLGNPTVGGLSDTFPRTSFYRYDNASQAVAPNNGLGIPGSVTFNSVNFSQGGSFGDGQAHHAIPGIEFFVRKELKAQKRWHLSAEAAVSWSHFSWVQRGSVPTTLNVTQDTYNTGTVDATGRAGVEGVFDPTLVPFPQWIGSTPTRTTLNVAGTLGGSRKLTLDAFQVRIGPSLGYRLTPRLSVDALAGLTLGIGFSRFNFSDTLTPAAGSGVSTVSLNGNDRDTHTWYGLYSALRATYDLTEKWQGLIEVRHLWMDSLFHAGSARSAQIFFTDGFTLSIGAAREF
ncbi:MAG: hypothetical protein HZA89_03060 [Verrucomicrobia bacterium]|nr:hypothetical protein [Verrucomicrobiota bacterium]